MIRALYSPATEDLVEQVLEVVPLEIFAGDDRKKDVEAIAAYLINRLRNDLGYRIEVEVEVHGKMEDALKSLNLASADDYVAHMRPVRRVKT